MKNQKSSSVLKTGSLMIIAGLTIFLLKAKGADTDLAGIFLTLVGIIWAIVGKVRKYEVSF